MATVADPLAPVRTPDRPGPGPLSASSLRALELSVGRRVDGLLAGDYRSAFAGVGSELWQVRPYEPGAAVRGVALHAIARTASPPVDRRNAPLYSRPCFASDVVPGSRQSAGAMPRLAKVSSM